MDITYGRFYDEMDIKNLDIYDRKYSEDLNHLYDKALEFERREYGLSPEDLSPEALRNTMVLLYTANREERALREYRRVRAEARRRAEK